MMENMAKASLHGSMELQSVPNQYNHAVLYLFEPRSSPQRRLPENNR